MGMHAEVSQKNKDYYPVTEIISNNMFQVRLCYIIAPANSLEVFAALVTQAESADTKQPADPQYHSALVSRTPPSAPGKIPSSKCGYFLHNSPNVDQFCALNSIYLAVRIFRNHHE